MSAVSNRGRWVLPIICMLLAAGLFPPTESASGQVAPGFRALLFTRTEGFRHASIEPAVFAFQELADAHGFEVERTEDPQDFSTENLARFDVVVFLLTSGDVLGRQQQAAFKDYVTSGGGFMGVHSAADTEYEWPFYGKLVGAYFESHARERPGRVLVVDRVHPSTESLPVRWNRTDEWYNFRSNPRGKVHVLATVDETSYEGKKMGPDHPISWCRTVSGSRTWYTGLGHSIASYSEPEFLEHILGGLRWAASAVDGDCTGTIWSYLQKVTLDRDTSDPMELDVAPDGSVYFVERLGAVKVFDPVSATTREIGKLDVFSGNEDGLLGIALDPNFAVTRWVYLFYSPAGKEQMQRVSRFSVGLDGIETSTERVLLEIPTQRKRCCHSAGSLTFGDSGDLYIATGDNTDPFSAGGYAPIDGRESRSKFDARATSANTNDLRGKILRIRPEPNGTYSIPSGNLFPAGTSKTKPEIFVMGVRNPFRIHFDPATDRLIWGDVGPDARDFDRRRGPRGYDEFNVATQPGNFGWPMCIADNRPYRRYDFASKTSGEPFDCRGGPRNDSPHNTGIQDLPPAVPSTIHYPYGRSKEFPLMGSGGGRAGFAGPVLRRAVSGNEGLPDYYEGTFFALEWARRYVREVRFDDAGRLVTISPFMTTTTFRRPMDMAQGPDGSLYLLEWGSTRIRGNTDSGLYRIVATVPGERYPTARASADRRAGATPLTVRFTGSRSSDRDEGQELTYAWDFQSDGIVDSTEADPTHTYSATGDHSARLVVTDETGRKSTAVVRITAGNRKPKVTLLAPPAGGFFAWGDSIAGRVKVTDAEDGSTTDGGIDCSSVTVQGLLGHNAHTHPLAQRSGCKAEFRTSGAGSHGNDDADLYYALRASYRDRGNGSAAPLEDSAIREFQPKWREAEHFDKRFNATPARDGEVIRIRRSGGYLVLKPVNLTRIGSLTLRFRSIERAGTVEVRKNGVRGKKLGSIDLRPSGAAVSRSTDIRKSGGSFALYLVFRSDGAPGRIADLDRANFHGRGIAVRK